MPVLVPIILVAGLAVGLSAALYSNREELKEIYEHRQELLDVFKQKQLEWRLKRGPRNRAREQGHNNSSSATGKEEHNDSYYMHDLNKESKERFTESSDEEEEQGNASFDEYPSSTSFYTNGQSSSAEQASNIDIHSNDLRHRAGSELNRQRSYYDDSRYNVEMYGFHRRGSESSSVIGIRPRSGSTAGSSTFSDMSEPSLSYSLGNSVSTHEDGWTRAGLSSNSSDTYSEISTPALSEANGDDYQSLVSESEDGTTNFRLQRAPQMN